MNARRRPFAVFTTLAWLWGATLFGRAQTNQAVYTDALQNGWVDYSWATVNFSNTNPVHGGTKSISVNCTNYQALYLHHASFDTSIYTNLTFWINGGATGGQPLQVKATLNGVSQSASYQMPAPPVNTWTNIIIPLSALGGAGAPNMDGFWVQSESGAAIPTFYVDDITLITNASSTPGTNSPALLTVDAGASRHAISPLIYGVAFASATQVADLNVPLNRSGGNAETRYNWQLNAHNHAADYYFESLADSPAVPGADSDSFISATKSGGAKPLITVPMIGWMPKLGPSRGRLASFSVAKYGAQTSTDPYFPDAGSGVSAANNQDITGNDPNDANFLTNSAFQQAYVQHLLTTWGVSANGGVGYYLMDNEHTLWHATHRDIHPVGTTMQEILGDIKTYAAIVKSLDSNALVLGPEEWGWPGYFYSGYDQQWSGANNNYNPAQYPDRGTNGGWDYMPWLLNQLHQQATNTNQRLLDYFTLHWYPQGGESGNDVSPSTQLLRNRSTRSLWDSNYVDASWINSIVQLIPRMQNWVATYYPGTKTGITEYNWGAEGYLNGATAQADILGIFGRQNLDLATRWTTPDASTPAYLAIKMYRNYDGHKATFGDTSVFTSGPNPDNVVAFAATRSSDSALTVMLVSKYLSGATPVALTLTNFGSTGTAQVWQLNSSNVIVRLGDATISAGKLNITVPGQSITLLVIPAKPLALQPGPARVDGQFQFWLNGQVGQTCILQFSTNLTSWLPVATNTLTSTQLNFILPAGSTQGFYRARLGS